MNVKRKIVKRDSWFSGFTLIEVMISLVVLAVGLLAIAQLQIAAMEGLSSSRHLTVATQLAEDTMEYLKAIPVNLSDSHAASTYLDSLGAAQPINDLESKPMLGDTVTGISPDTVGDSKPSLHLHPDNPLNEWGQKWTKGDGMKYYVRWWSEWGGTDGTPAKNGAKMGFPDKNEIVIRVEVFWWQGKETKPANLELDKSHMITDLKGLTNNTTGSGFLTLNNKVHQVTLESVRAGTY